MVPLWFALIYVGCVVLLTILGIGVEDTSIKGAMWGGLVLAMVVTFGGMWFLESGAADRLSERGARALKDAKKKVDVGGRRQEAEAKEALGAFFSDLVDRADTDPHARAFLGALEDEGIKVRRVRREQSSSEDEPPF